MKDGEEKNTRIGGEGQGRRATTPSIEESETSSAEKNLVRPFGAHHVYCSKPLPRTAKRAVWLDKTSQRKSWS